MTMTRPLARSARLVTRTAVAVAALFAATAPAHAQFFWVSPDNRGAPVTAADTDIGIPLPGATAAEFDAAMVWTLRTGLNTAALQCQFSPMLMAVDNYNIALDRHSAEFVRAYNTIEGYFKRTGGRGWQAAFDTYRTRLYNYFATVNAQFTFCQTAGSIGFDAIYAPVGGMAALARNRMREFKNSLVFRGDQIRMSYRPQWTPLVLPDLRDDCWDKNNRLRRKCQASYIAQRSAANILVSS